jgi:nicotinate-nucleotide adenylyltransferase
LAKIGLLGGTFDPPHYGHLLIAQEALTQCDLDEIWFVPSALPPHKMDKKITSDEQRIEMVKKAITGHPYFSMSLIEFDRVGRSFTIDTVKELKEQYCNNDFYFIIGADMVNDLPNWKGILELIDIVTFIGVKRPGYVINSPFLHKVIMIEVPQLDISSSILRERFRKIRNTRYLLPESVREYIEVNQIYG